MTKKQGVVFVVAMCAIWLVILWAQGLPDWLRWGIAACFFVFGFVYFVWVARRRRPSVQRIDELDHVALIAAKSDAPHEVSLGYTATWEGYPSATSGESNPWQQQPTRANRVVLGGVRVVVASGTLGFDEAECTHGVTFDSAAAEGLSVAEVRSLWPRHFGECPKGCGFSGIEYASTEHYVMGDW